MSRKHKQYARTILGNKILSTCVCISILLLGLILSILGFETAFQRSGAVLVSLAVASLAINNFLSLELQFADTLHMLAGSKTTEEGLLIAQKHIKNEPNLELFVKNSMDGNRTQSIKIHNEILELQSMEFMAAFVGTLIWAFGDLPFCG